MKAIPRKAIDRSPAQPPKRPRDGFSVIELLVTVGLVAIMLGIASPTMPRGAFALWGANQQLIADLRRTRTDALTKGDHFRLQVTSATEYVQHRLRLVGAVWVPDVAPVRSRRLPAGVTFAAGVGTSFEFNTRGLLVIPEAAASLQLRDAHSSATRQITVWPSGQVAPI
jgi:prepilin-type N-terminal cleavage/methylation domain-containing protein